jgi:hypothetical protein
VPVVFPSDLERIRLPDNRGSAHGGLGDVILEMTASGTPVIGAIGPLARAWGVTASELRAVLRTLLESDRITVQMDPSGRLTIREAQTARTARFGPASAHGSLPRNGRLDRRSRDVSGMGEARYRP